MCVTIGLFVTAELRVEFLEEVYTIPEDAGGQMVCLAVFSGTLAPGVSVMVNLVTSPGNGML